MQMSHNWQHALTKQRAVEDLHHGKVGTLIWSIITASLAVRMLQINVPTLP
jgi:hypothetical protein